MKKKLVERDSSVSIESFPNAFNKGIGNFFLMEIQFTISHVFEAPTFILRRREGEKNFYSMEAFMSKNDRRTTTTRSSKLYIQRRLLKGALLTQRSYFLFCHISHNVHKNIKTFTLYFFFFCLFRSFFSSKFLGWLESLIKLFFNAANSKNFKISRVANWWIDIWYIINHIYAFLPHNTISRPEIDQ